MKLFYFSRKVWWVACILLVFGLGYLAGRWTTGSLPTTGKIAKEMPIFYVKTKVPEICLTFDISWGEQTWPRVLKILKEHQVPATFFVSGPWGVRNPQALRAIYDSGHEIASHGDRHINLSQYSKAVVERNVLKSHQDLLTVIERVAPFFRPPNGDYDDMVIDTARELGFETVIWAVDSLDWKNPGADYMVKRVLERAFPGAILLFHASDSSKQIDRALSKIIRGLRMKGYKPVVLSQLVKDGEAARNDPR